MQEAVVSMNNKVYCGPHTLSWDSLALATFLLSDPSFSQAWLEKKSLPFHELLTRNVYQDTLEGGKLVPVKGDTVVQDALSLEKLLHIARQRQATDPKGKVFNLFGIA